MTIQMFPGSPSVARTVSREEGERLGGIVVPGQDSPLQPANKGLLGGKEEQNLPLWHSESPYGDTYRAPRTGASRKRITLAKATVVPTRL